ncbi:MAG: type II toxin-antitoxin system VapC family toxin [Gammaproteobacteria bacterium]
MGNIGISSVKLAELQYGVEKSQHTKKNRAALDAFILPLEIVSFDENAAYHYGLIRARLEKKGCPIGPMDLMIAAHADCLQVTLVTNNTKAFSRILHLAIENWINT